jgi:DUF1365 family protein
MQSSLQLGSVFHNRIFPYNHQFKYKTLSILINLEELNNINKLFLFLLTHSIFLVFFLKIMVKEMKIIILKTLY